MTTIASSPIQSAVVADLLAMIDEDTSDPIVTATVVSHYLPEPYRSMSPREKDQLLLQMASSIDLYHRNGTMLLQANTMLAQRVAFLEHLLSQSPMK